MIGAVYFDFFFDFLIAWPVRSTSVLVDACSASIFFAVEAVGPLVPCPAASACNIRSCAGVYGIIRSARVG